MRLSFRIMSILFVAFYLLPTFISGQRGTANQTGIFWVNFLFGWTVLGWIAALNWACTEQRTEVEE